MGGLLRVVSTPIGNLGDLSERARAALAGADLIACEDTRHTGRLLAHLGLRSRLVSLHEHNEARRVPELLERLVAGATVALVADAGTPLLCDPGFLLVRESVRRGVMVEAVPGPSALLAALVVSGFPPYPFTFAGFAPRRSSKRRTFYRTFGGLGHTVVCYESPHRLSPSLQDAAAELGPDRPAVLARELTKLHEQVARGTLGELAAATGGPPTRGEIVLVIAGAADPAPGIARDRPRPAGRDAVNGGGWQP